VLKGCRTLDLDVLLAKLGGQLCGSAGTSDLTDAVVAVLAIRLRAGVVTSDPDDLVRLTEAAGRRVPIFAI
jgi:predicted nucleic acid-binding protein